MADGKTPGKKDQAKTKKNAYGETSKFWKDGKDAYKDQTPDNIKKYGK